MQYPKDCEARKIGSKAKVIVYYSFNTEHWDVKEQTGSDVGIDCIAELSENDEWHNRKLECQIKGRTYLNILQNGDISFPMDVKTINYALSSSIPFILIVVDVNEKIPYYLPIQKYFIENPNEIKKLNNSVTINVHLNRDKVVNNFDFELQKLTHSTYCKTENELIPIEIK